MVHENGGISFSIDDILPHIKTPEELLSAITETYKEMYAQKSDASSHKEEAEKELLKSFGQKANRMGISSYEVAVAVMKGMPRSAKQLFFEEIERGAIFFDKSSAYFETEITPEEVLKLKNMFTLSSVMDWNKAES